jgi:hypothetical protein
VKRWQRGISLAALLLGAAALDPITQRHLRTASLLLRASSSEAPTGLAAFGVVPVVEEAGVLQAPTGPTRMKIYKPRGATDAPALVLVPGVHRLGVDEPRLTRFARALSSAGLVVITPEIRELTDYRIDEASAGTIGAAAAEIGRRSGRDRVGVLGFSFAGGLSLLAAAHPDHGRHIGFVVSIGGHHDLGRVMRYLVTGQEPCLGGETLTLTPHDYGLVVLLYGYTGRFFGPRDEPAAHEALRLWLADRRDEAREKARGLSPAGLEKIERIFSGRTSSLAPELLAALDASSAELARVSPRGPLGTLRATAYLLHGWEDSVIPRCETPWTASELASSHRGAHLGGALVTPAIQHVELRGTPPLVEQLRVVHFLASLLEEAEREPLAQPPEPPQVP